MMKKVYLFIALILFSSFGVAMSFFDAGKACVFSEINMSITHEGKPASHAKIVREIEWNKEVVEEFVADEFGAINMPKVLQRSVSQLLPAEFVVAQVITVSYQDQEYRIWVNSKRDTTENSELGGAPLKLVCELTSKPKLYRDFGSLLKTSCSWN